MENRSILIAFLATWAVYLVAIYWYAERAGLNKGAVTASHAAPSVVAVSMTYIFLIMGGGTVRQLVAGSERGMDLWSLWAGLWPPLLLLTLGAVVCQAIWVGTCCLQRKQRVWIPVAASGMLMSGFAHATVISNFPDA